MFDFLVQFRLTHLVLDIVLFHFDSTQIFRRFFYQRNGNLKNEERGEYTLVSHTIIVRTGSFFQKMAWVLKVRRKHDKMVEDFLENLQKVSET